MTTTIDALTKRDTVRLLNLERTVETGLATFVEVGSALKTIRDEKLFRGTHVNFVDYADDRFNLKKSQAYRLIEASDVAAEFSPMGEKQQPSSERVARELAKVDPEERAEVWAEALESNAEPTAADVRAVAESRGAERKPTDQPKPDNPSELVAKIQAQADQLLEIPNIGVAAKCIVAAVGRQSADRQDMFWAVVHMVKGDGD